MTSAAVLDIALFLLCLHIHTQKNVIDQSDVEKAGHVVKQAIPCVQMQSFLHWVKKE